MLYYRVAKYLRGRTGRIEERINGGSVLTDGEVGEARELLLLVEEVYGMNESVRLIYLGKYFAQVLRANEVFLPTLFQSSLTVEMLYYSLSKDRHAHAKRSANQSLCSTSVSSSNVGLALSPKMDVREVVQEVNI